MEFLQNNQRTINVNKIHCSTLLSKTFITEKSDKVNFKGVSVHAMKAYKGSADMAPLILNLGTRWT
jgi:hypothetical protein